MYRGFVFVLAMSLQMIAGQGIGNIYNANIGNAMAANAMAANAIAANTMAANAVNTAEAAITNGMAYGPYSGHGYPGYIDPNYPNPLAYPASPIPCEVEVPFVSGIPGITYGLTLNDLAASRGGGLRVITSSPISPTGITVQSDNMAVDGPLSVTGQLPFLGVVSVEGPLAALGSGSVAYGCGNGNVGMVNEGINEPAPLAKSPYGNYPNPGFAPGFAPGHGMPGIY